MLSAALSTTSTATAEHDPSYSYYTAHEKNHFFLKRSLFLILLRFGSCDLNLTMI